jgi:type I restriction enzyme S subunit
MINQTDWTAYKINELGKLGRGKSRHRPRNEPSLFGGEYPFIQTGDIKAANLYINSFSQTYSEKGLAQSKLWEPGTLCITIAANIAETAILSIQACFPDSIVGFVANPEKSNAKFIKYYIDFIKLQMKAVSQGTTQDNLSVDKLQKFDFVVPNVETQRKIAAVLSAYDDLIENNSRRIAILEEMAQRIYREWFVHFRYPGHEDVPLVEVDGVSRPEGWKVVRLGDIAKEERRTVKPSEIDPKTPYMGLAHLPKKSIALTSWGTADEAGSNKLVFNQGEILFGKIRPYFHKVGIAPINGVCSTDTIVINPKQPIYKYLVLSVVSSENFVNHATQTSKGTKMPRADWKVLVDYRVPIGDQELFEAFNQTIQPKIDLILNLIHKNNNLRVQRDLLLPKLISGQLDVSELDIDVLEVAG